MNYDNGTAASIVLESSETHSDFWVAAYPFFETSIFFMPSSSHMSSENEIETSHINIYDPDGEHINQVEFSYPTQKVGVLEMAPLLGPCKLESGFKHAHVSITSNFKTNHYCRISAAGNTAILGRPMLVSDRKDGFFPVTMSANRNPMLCLVNQGSGMGKVLCRLFCGKRMPEKLLTVPAKGCRIFFLNSIFPEFSDYSETGKSMQGYIRLASKDFDNIIGAHFIERLEGGISESISSNDGIYTIIS